MRWSITCITKTIYFERKNTIIFKKNNELKPFRKGYIGVTNIYSKNQAPEILIFSRDFFNDKLMRTQINNIIVH